MLAKNRVPSPSCSPQHVAVPGYRHQICTGTWTTRKTDEPMDVLRALAAATNKTVNNYVNNEPDLPVGQVTVAGIFFVSKQFQVKKKKPNKQTFVKKTQLPAASIPWLKIAIFFHKKSRKQFGYKNSWFYAKHTEKSSQEGLKTLFISQVAASSENMEIFSRRLQLRLKKKKKGQFPPSYIVSSPSWAGLGLTVWQQPC